MIPEGYLDLLLAESSSFGELLKRCRTLAERTQESVASEAGITAAYLSSMERNEKLPSASTAFDLARVLNLTEDLVLHRIFDRMRERNADDLDAYRREFREAAQAQSQP